MPGYADPKYLIGLKNLYLAAKTTVDGFMTGLNKSRIKGRGTEFSQYRSYQAGDDLRWLDWKMFARSDRYYIRESEMETQIGITFMLDASASMRHEDNDISKLEFGKYIIGCLAYLATMHGDAVGMATFSEGHINNLASRQSFQHLSRLLHRLENVYAGGRFTEPVHYKKFMGTTRRKELVVFVTDMYQQEVEIFKLLELIKAMGHDLIVFQLIGQNEISLNYKGFTALEDLETGETIAVDVESLRKTYHDKLDQFLTGISKKMLEKQVDYALIKMNDKVDEVLRKFLTQRAKH